MINRWWFQIIRLIIIMFSDEIQLRNHDTYTGNKTDCEVSLIYKQEKHSDSFLDSWFGLLWNPPNFCSFFCRNFYTLYWICRITKGLSRQNRAEIVWNAGAQTSVWAFFWTWQNKRKRLKINCFVKDMKIIVYNILKRGNKVYREVRFILFIVPLIQFCMLWIKEKISFSQRNISVAKQQYFETLRHLFGRF